MNTDDEGVLREIFAEHDPAASSLEPHVAASNATDQPGRGQDIPVAASPVHPAGSGSTAVHGPARRGSRWLLPAVAAAVVAAAVITPAIWSSSRPDGPTPVNPAAGASQAPAGPVARTQYDHVRWQSYTDTALAYTVDWWFNGVSGRELKTDASGTVLSDLTLSYASTQSPSVTASATARPSTSASGTASPVASLAPTPATEHDLGAAATGDAAAGTPAPTAGVEPVGDDFPGHIPTTVADLRSYLARPGAGGTVQAIEGIMFQRVLDAAQMNALTQVARALPAATAPRTATTPTGIPVQLISPTDPATVGGPANSLVLSAADDQIIGVSGTDANGDTWWQLVQLSEHTSDT